MNRFATFGIYLVALIGSFGASPARADNYDICYQQIKKKFGPYTDITWMHKVWECTAKMDEAGQVKKKRPGSSDAAPSAAVETATCDFDTKVGECDATATVAGSGRNGQTYSAQITIKSSAGACSKVVYLLDNLPQTALIQGGDTVVDTLFNARPITQAGVIVSKCTVHQGGKVAARRNDDLKKYGRCLGIRDWMKKLDEEYASSSAVVGNDLDGIKGFVDYFAHDKKNKFWIRRNNLVKKCG